jgi:fumarylacetoacetase
MTALQYAHPAIADPSLSPNLKSWVASANQHPQFPIQNLPIGIFSHLDGRRRGGIAIGDQILDLGATLRTGLLTGPAARAAEAAALPTLNVFLALGPLARISLRKQISALLDENTSDGGKLAGCLFAAAECSLHMPAQVGDFTDFFAGIQHATNVGELAGRDDPLPGNYKFMPLAYAGRASSVQEDGVPVKRPCGQRKPNRQLIPDFGPSRFLDFELELGIWIGSGNNRGEPIPIEHAPDHMGGFCLVNDWSARDLQHWEQTPLGPFAAKGFATTVSPWIVTPEALLPFRIAPPPRDASDPELLPYLRNQRDQQTGASDIRLTAAISTEAMRAAGMPPFPVSRSNTAYLYWTYAQLIAHHTASGCDLRPGDLLGTGTISAPTPAGYGSLLEITAGGRSPLLLPTGETRRGLDDGDEIILEASCARDGFASIGFGRCGARITPPM